MQIVRPETMVQAMEALKTEGAKALAGGTNVMVDLKKGRETGSFFVSLDALEELKRIEEKEDGLHLGSMVTFTQVEDYFLENRNGAFQALLQAASLVGGPQIRNRGTLGGNVLCASPSSDSVPALLVLDASLRLKKSDQTERIVPLNGFVSGVRETRLEPGELLTEIIVPWKQGNSCFYKAGTRNAMAISVVNQALYLKLNQDARVAEAAVALGSVAPTVVRALETERFLIGKTAEELLSEACIREARQILCGEIAPITDLRAEKEYRYLVSENILEENLKTLLGGCYGR